MPASIKFIAGRRAPARYVYRNEDLFQPGLMSASAEPLRLTDFKDLHVLSQGLLSDFTLKCYFNDGTEAVATADMEMMRILQQFLYNLKNTQEGQEPEIPTTDSETWIFVLIFILIFLICLLLIIR